MKMKMKTIKTIKIKWSKPIIVAIIAAIVVQVLWGIGIPVGNWLQEIIFKITTLGLSSLSNSFYRGVARGLHEESSLWVFLLVILLYLNIYDGSQKGKKGKTWHVNRELNKKIEEYKKLHPEEEEILIENVWKEYNEIFDKAERSDTRSNRLRFTVRITVILFLFFQYFTISNQNRAITKFRRAITIGKPYLSEQEEEKILSKFAMIENKQDYLNVLSTLRQKFEKIGQKAEKEKQRLEKEKQRLEKELQRLKKEREDATSSSDVKDKTK